MALAKDTKVEKSCVTTSICKSNIVLRLSTNHSYTDKPPFARGATRMPRVTPLISNTQTILSLNDIYYPVPYLLIRMTLNSDRSLPLVKRNKFPDKIPDRNRARPPIGTIREIPEIRRRFATLAVRHEMAYFPWESRACRAADLFSAASEGNHDALTRLANRRVYSLAIIPVARDSRSCK